ncbi:MAG: hypothetical protein ACE5FB_01355 [Candidatus Binatia bacterium]
MKNLLIAFAVLVSISCNTLADWRVVVTINPNPSEELIAEYDIKVGSPGGPYTVLTTLPASGAMYFVQTHAPGTGPFAYTSVARNVLGAEGPEAPEQIATEPDPPPAIPGPSTVGLDLHVLGQ